jgi:hypothetical protein
LKPEWWGSPLAQEQKYEGRKKPVTRNDDDDNDNNNNKRCKLQKAPETICCMTR